MENQKEINNKNEQQNEIISSPKQQESDIYHADLIELQGYFAQFNEDDLEVDNILTTVFRTIDTSNIAESIEPESIYQVIIGEGLQNDLNSGEQFFTKDKKTGELFAQVRKKNDEGKNVISQNLKMKEREITYGNPVHDISMNIQNANLQKQMTELKKLTQNVYSSVLHVEEGQMNDRLAHLDAGERLLKQALTIIDNPQLQLQLFSEGIKELNESRSEIYRALEQKIKDFEPIPEDWKKKLWKEFKQKGWFRQRDQAYVEIQYLFNCFLQSTTLIGGAYAYLGQEKTIIETFKQSFDDIKKLDFSKVSTIKRIHLNKEIPLLKAPSYVEAERDFILDNFDNVNCKIEISGKKIIGLLESGKDDNNGTVCNSNSGEE